MKDSIHVYSVGELTTEIKHTLEDRYGSVWVSGEISNFIHHRSGHMYFTLKDSQSELKAVMFKGNNHYLRFKPENGMQVMLQGRISVYEPRGYYQIIANRMEPAGVGTLHLAYEALKKQLLSEGLFTAEHKLKLPDYPRRIGIITSPTGAAVRDMIQILKRRAPQVDLILRPTLVQGETAATDICAAITEFTEYGEVDLIILGRGGGSLEDIWPFNEEAVARAVYACPIPTISAVGHETDTAITDLVADLRAPTPSAAAELAAPSQAEIESHLAYYRERSEKALASIMERKNQQVDQLTTRYGFQRPGQIVDHLREQLNNIQHLLVNSTGNYLPILSTDLKGLEARLVALNPENILNRGYAIAQEPESGKIIRSSDQLSTGQSFTVRFAQGRITAEKTGDAD